MAQESHPLDAIFRPRCVAVVGASNRTGSIGREVLKNLVAGGFSGKVFPVNAKQGVVLSMKAYGRVSDIPDPVDLAVIVVPKHQVAEVVEDCAQKGVRGVVVVTAGFREVGGAGIELEADLVERLRQHGMYAIGPNCMGVIHTDETVRLNASFSRMQPSPGNIAFLSQSGALGEAILGNAEELGLGVSLFASLGNQANVNVTDVLDYLEADTRSEVVLLYQESFGDPHRFPQVAKRVARKKPIVAVKSGRSAAGARAAFSHTGSLAGAEVAVDALFDECGVVRVGTVEELFEVASGFAHQPLPRGRRVGVVTNAGGPGILAADACAAHGFSLPALGDATRLKLRPLLSPDASLRNPVDLIAGAGPEDYAHALPAVMNDPEIDAVIVIFVPPVMVNAPDVARAIAQARRAAMDKPLFACFMAHGPGADEGLQILRRAKIPTYDFPESAARALSAMRKYAEWRTRPEGRVAAFSVDKPAAQAAMDRMKAAGAGSLQEGFALLQAYGVPVAPVRFEADWQGVLAAAQDFGFPVVLKVDAKSLVHKSDAGAVVADIRDEVELKHAFDRVPKVADGVFVVQPMLKGAQETALGMVTDAAFGPLLMFGLGGIHIEVLKDVAFKVHPLGSHDPEEMMGKLRGAALLDGVRGASEVDKVAIKDALLRLSQLVSDWPELAEIEINPFLAGRDGHASAAVDVRLRLHAWEAPPSDEAP